MIVYIVQYRNIHDYVSVLIEKGYCIILNFRLSYVGFSTQRAVFVSRIFYTIFDSFLPIYTPVLVLSFQYLLTILIEIFLCFRMATVLKAEPIDAVNLHSRILDLLAESPNGMFDGELRQKISHIPDEQRVAAINYLLTKGKIDLIKAKNTDMIGYKLRNPETLK